MDVVFIPISEENLAEVTKVYNYYVRYSTVTFHLDCVSHDEMKKLIPFKHHRYPSYVISLNDKIVGYCYLSTFRPKEAYDITAEITLYILPEGTQKGLGSMVLTKLEEEAKKLGIKNLIAVITGENEPSVKLFEKNNYFKAAHLKNVGFKFNRMLDVFWYQKEI